MSNQTETMEAGQSLDEIIMSKILFWTKITRDEQGKKKYKIPAGWQNKVDFNKWNMDMKNKNENDALCILTGARNNLFVIDFDNVDLYNRFSDEFDILKKCFRVKTKKGYHCYFKYRDGLTCNDTKDNLKDIDLLGNGAHVIGPYSYVDGKLTYEIDNAGKMDYDCPDDLLNAIYKECAQENQYIQRKEKVECSQDLKYKVVDLIDVCYLDNYQDWIKICWGMDFEGFDREDIKKISMKSSKFTEKGFYDLFNGFINDGSIRMGTLNYYSKMSNKEEYLKLMIKMNTEKKKKVKNENEIKKSYDYFKIKKFIWENPDFYDAVKINSLGSFYIKYKGKYLLYDLSKLRVSFSHIKVKIENKKGIIEKVNFIDIWVQDENIRNKMEIVNMPPCKVKDYDDVYNLWENFDIENVEKVEDKPGAVNMFIEHINILFNRKTEDVDFMLNWFSHLFKYPEIKTGIMPILIGDEGIGKDTLTLIINKLMGRKLYFKSTKPENDILGNFNGVLSKARFIQFSEIGFLNTKDKLNVLKDLITAETIEITYKGKDTFDIESFHNYIVLTNKEMPIPMESGAEMRRFWMTYLNSELIGNNDYFEKFYSMMEDEQCLKSIYEYLINRKETPKTFNKHNVPISSYQENMKEVFEDYDIKWFKQLIQENKEIGIIRYSSREIFDLFKYYLIENEVQMKYSNKKFGMFMTKMISKSKKTIDKKKVKGNVYYEIDFSKISI